MEGRPRRSFTEDCKRQCAELVVSSGRSITSLAKELGLRASVLRRWVEQFEPQPTSAARRLTTHSGARKRFCSPRSDRRLRESASSAGPPD